MSHRSTSRRRSALLAVTVFAAVTAANAILFAAPASAHGFSSVAYVDVTAPDDEHVRTQLDLEYDLLVVSAADTIGDPEFFDTGMDLFETGEEATALAAHKDTVLKYVDQRFSVSVGDKVCTPSMVGDFEVHERDDVPYARFTIDHDCSAASEGGTSGTHQIRSGLFPDSEEYVKDTKTIVTYELDGRTGSAALDAGTPSFSTTQHWTDRFKEFFLLGAEHLLGGLDHILFLLALIVGSRRLRDVVLAATTFTVAHSVTFLLAALGLVSVPSAVVEPIIALSIAVVAAWYLWGVWRRRTHPEQTERVHVDRLGLDRADRLRLAVVFCFGLVHGLGFAGALGIDEPWSWTLLWSLLVFNIGIEVVQLGLVAVIFPTLMLLRRRVPRVGLWVGGTIAAGVTAMGLIWFAQRILGIE
ncbi:HupE/UreJ family protein [Nakamurella silvestris]|nr:HupE/UreJ family protein [Nakamurella silvestris]